MNKKRKILLWVFVICFICLSIGLLLSKGRANLVWQFVSTGFRPPKDYSSLGDTDKVGFVVTIISCFFTVLFGVIALIAMFFGPTRKDQLTSIKQVEEIKEQNKQTQEMISKLAKGLESKIEPVGSRGLPVTQLSKETNVLPRTKRTTVEVAFDKARKLAEKTARKKEADLVNIYRLLGKMEFDAGNYKDAAKWYEKISKLAAKRN